MTTRIFNATMILESIFEPGRLSLATLLSLNSPDKRHDHEEAVPVPDVEAVGLDGVLLGEREVVDGVPLPVAYLVLGLGPEHRLALGYAGREVQSDGLLIHWFVQTSNTHIIVYKGRMICKTRGIP